MGYAPCQPTLSPGRLPVDAPKRYGWGAPARSTSRAVSLQPARLGAAVGTRRRLCSACVLFCLRSVSRRSPGPEGAVVSPARCSSALSPRDLRALCCGLSHPCRAHARRRLGQRPCGWLPGLGMCMKDPGACPHFQRDQRGPERVGFSEEPCPGAKVGGRGSALEGWKRLGRRVLFSLNTRFGFGGERSGPTDTVGKRR